MRPGRGSMGVGNESRQANTDGAEAAGCDMQPVVEGNATSCGVWSTQAL